MAKQRRKKERVSFFVRAKEAIERRKKELKQKQVEAEEVAEQTETVSTEEGEK